ncbi:Crossover junction endonuclease mus81 [Lobosporangium transversale]|uniref:Crossover junction endonuclease MUS81 n=1 Tax=Lobosporangium transversale TaxID=64571 RepID=A0A1Y2GPN6_9FUNG|nr:hypothetical protein BCR41DRAFT_322644 [Lobosporangium transversale]KAF9914675.1 Crossover junction endonuclease mus81 [Lobosporangium transversale]ORZ16142.1 hypothetical protein BCR41DRAFT_322644 [Lobosporangium transversale]|eukprot:XP_021881489.1 hypothetical protein BCR41DRAFT_322644 [Lobosporangium transversale]
MECGNPLFLEWIGEWMEHARELGSQSYYIYRKAYESMAKYPTKFNHPIEALCLSGIGEKTVAKLEKRLIEHCRENDLPMPSAVLKRPRVPKKNVDSNGAEGDEGTEESKSKRLRARNQKPYVPTYRSGAYAILLTLLDAWDAKTPDGDGALTKHELVTRGQVYCDASLTNPEYGKFFTAWSSMRTLLSKNLVYQSSSNYYLTDEGREIARMMRTIAQDGGNPETNTTLTEADVDSETWGYTAPPLRHISRTPQLIQEGDDGPDDLIDFISERSSSASSLRRAPAVATSSPSTEVLRVQSSQGSSYNDHSGEDNCDTWKSVLSSWNSSISDSSKTRDDTFQAVSSVESSLPSGLNTARPTASSLFTSSTRSNGPSPQVIDILSDSDEENLPSTTRSTTTPLPPPERRTSMDPGLLTSDHIILQDAPAPKSVLSRTTSQFKLPTHPATEPSAPTTKAGLSRQMSSNATSNVFDESRTSSVQRSSSSKLQRKDGASVSGRDAFPHLRSHSFSLRSIPNDTSPKNIKQLAAFKPVIFYPGSFEICLVLDIREVRTQTDRDYIGQRLKDRGVNVIKRALDIGDIIWIARLKTPSASSPSEIVLDYILERKRMDDLVHSIKDGRFNEQKFRLRRSGLGHVIYLIETHKMGETYDIGTDAIRTAMTSTQIHDGFFLRRTNHTDQTIEYFVSVTNALRKLYESKALYAIPDEAIDRASYLDLQSHLKATNPDRTYLTSYKSFGALNGKSETIVVRDTFVKMLMTIRGISSEKAMEIARAYPTPRAMFSALDEQDSDTQRDRILVRTSSAINKRRIGEALSKKIAEIWYSDVYSKSLNLT